MVEGMPDRRQVVRALFGGLVAAPVLALDGALSKLIAQVLDPILGLHARETTRLLVGYFADEKKKGRPFLQSLGDSGLQKAFVEAIGKSIQSVYQKNGVKDVKQNLMNGDELVKLTFSHFPEAYKNHRCTAALSPEQLKGGEEVLREIAHYIASEITRTTSI